MYRDVGTVISRVAAEHGFSVVKSFCGHGVGQLFHCAPNVPHYAKNKAVGMMKAGCVPTHPPAAARAAPIAVAATPTATRSPSLLMPCGPSLHCGTLLQTHFHDRADDQRGDERG